MESHFATEPRGANKFDPLHFGARRRERAAARASLQSPPQTPPAAEPQVDQLDTAPSPALLKRLLALPKTLGRPRASSPSLEPGQRASGQRWFHRGQPSVSSAGSSPTVSPPQTACAPLPPPAMAVTPAGFRANRATRLYGTEGLRLNERTRSFEQPALVSSAMDSGLRTASTESYASSWWTRDDSPLASPAYPHSTCTLSDSAELLAAELEVVLRNHALMRQPGDEAEWGVAYKVKLERASAKRGMLVQRPSAGAASVDVQQQESAVGQHAPSGPG